jgi:serine/threonine-protein kinase
VFRAYNPEQDRLVAVKLFRLDLAPERVHKLVAQLEALIDADLTHAAIAAPIAAGISDVSAYLALDFVAADSIDIVAREHGPAPASEAVRIATQMAGALEFAAEADVAHGALHPRDVLVSSDDTRITGVGITQALERLGVATPVRRPYTAPERSSGGAWDRRADVFSLAAIIHEVLWGRRIAAMGEQLAASLTAIPHADLTVLRRLFARALAEQPEERLDSAMEFADQLRIALTPVRGEERPPAGPSTSLRAGASGELRYVAEEDLRLPLEDDDAPQISEVDLERERASESQLDPPLEPVPPSLQVNINELDQLHLHSAQKDQPEPVVEIPIAIDQSEPELRPIVPAKVPNPEAVMLPIDRPPALEPARPRPAIAAAPALFGSSESALERGGSAVWPLVLALGLGLSVGFAAGYGVANRPPVEPAPISDPLADDANATAKTSGVGVEVKEDAVHPTAMIPDSRPEPPVPVEPSGRRDEPAAASREETTRPGSTERAATASTGRVLIRSTPAGARAFIDGKEVGRTPVTTRAIGSGSHTVRVEREGFVAEEQKVAVSSSRPSASLTFTLERVATRNLSTPAANRGGLVSFESRPPGARVMLDGRAIGTTPMTLSDVTAGSHTVSLDLPGYRRWTASVDVVAGERNRVAASLER